MASFVSADFPRILNTGSSSAHGTSGRSANREEETEARLFQVVYEIENKVNINTYSLAPAS
jgi:hypothetical protein